MHYPPRLTNSKRSMRCCEKTETMTWSYQVEPIGAVLMRTIAGQRWIAAGNEPQVDGTADRWGGTNNSFPPH